MALCSNEFVATWAMVAVMTDFDEVLEPDTFANFMYCVVWPS